MALSADTPRAYELGDVNELAVAASTKIYEGSAVGDNGSGYARCLNAGDPFRGFAERQSDNSSGAAGAKTVRVKTDGKAEITLSGVAITDVGKDVFMSDDGTFTLTQGSNTRVGYIHRYVSTNTCILAFKANYGALAELTDNSGGTASDTIADVPASYTEATLANQIASLAAKINALIRRLGN
jgi:hypothetical protein